MKKLLIVVLTNIGLMGVIKDKRILSDLVIPGLAAPPVELDNDRLTTSTRSCDT